MFLSISTLNAIGVDGTTMLTSTEAKDLNRQSHSAIFSTLGHSGRECREIIWRHRASPSQAVTGLRY